MKWQLAFMTSLYIFVSVISIEKTFHIANDYERLFVFTISCVTNNMKFCNRDLSCDLKMLYNLLFSHSWNIFDTLTWINFLNTSEFWKSVVTYLNKMSLYSKLLDISGKNSLGSMKICWIRNKSCKKVSVKIEMN
jgi:hypothetical protein